MEKHDFDTTGSTQFKRLKSTHAILADSATTESFGGSSHDAPEWTALGAMLGRR